MDLLGRRRIIGLGIATAITLGTRAASAQAGSAIEGRVTADGRGPLAGANVQVVSYDLPDGMAILTTDDAGAFQVPDAPEGLYDIFVSHPKFLPGEWRDLRVKAGQVSRLDIAMAPKHEGSPGY